MRALWLIGALALLSCTGTIKGPPGTQGGGAGVGGGGATEEPCVETDPTAAPPNDTLSPLRLLRRTSLALRGVPASDAEQAALLAAGDEAAQRLYVEHFVDQTLASPAFYQTMFELARGWFMIPLIPNDADAPEYAPKQQRILEICPAGTDNAGAFVYYRDQLKDCTGAKATAMVEPWWAPGTMIRLVGSPANPNDGAVCEGRPRGTCGCGPHAVGCWYVKETYPGWAPFISFNPHGQRRLLQEESARLFAHLAWYDRPVTDLVLGDYSVGPVELQAALINTALETGALQLQTDDRWWQPSKFAGVPVDPLHDANDAWAWREYTVSERNPFLLADRSYKYDPRTQNDPVKGVPSAGVLTQIGFMGAYPRERVRAARALETFACEVLSPPNSQDFNPYISDPGKEGPCQNCHRRIDPAAIHFKRFARDGQAFEGWGGLYPIAGVGKWHWPGFEKGMYPFGHVPFTEWNHWYQANTVMTPISQTLKAMNPESIFIDFLPPDQTLLGQTSDGTIGPLGFAKMIVASGAFDRCVVRHLHQQVLGRDIDPALEAGYLDDLTAKFISKNRAIRPFVKTLTQSVSMGRGL